MLKLCSTLRFHTNFVGGLLLLVEETMEDVNWLNGTIKIDKLDLEDVYFVKELKFILFSVYKCVFVTKELCFFSLDFLNVCKKVLESTDPSKRSKIVFSLPYLMVASYFEDITPQSVDDVQLQGQDGNHDDSSFQDDGIDDHQVNTASPQVNTGSSDLVLLIMMLFLLHSEGLIGTKSYLEDSQRRIKEQGYWYKWVLQKQEDERGTVLARCVVAIRIFLAYASFMGFTVYQMDVKSAFLYGQIEEEVYVCQPPGFEDPDHPDKIYVDDIIFGSTKKELCEEFEKLMKDKFQMSSMGELTFFLGLQVQQKQKGIFIMSS
ncbi:putative ribonuclease H-like domain-containing protein [Tanacetum coccineum]|uniref:Ribonuclease H-like domain-containing protein n=1 Tax=Tanacetum coccineum TaxID=301880 RepID=A0ABQ4ZNU7_9ASTR